jgi:hypothetical protein
MLRDARMAGSTIRAAAFQLSLNGRTGRFMSIDTNGG